MIASVSHSWQEIKVEAFVEEEEILCKKCLLSILPSDPQERLGPFLFHRDCYQAHLRYLDILDRNRKTERTSDDFAHFIS